MDVSRRGFITKSVGAAAAAGALGLLGIDEVGGEEEAMIVGACGVWCSTCPALHRKECKGCGPGNVEGAAESTCPIRQCAAKRGIPYCEASCAVEDTCLRRAVRGWEGEQSRHRSRP